MNFSEWLIDEARRAHKSHPDQRTLFNRDDFVPPKKARPAKNKTASIAHKDIDRWLKSVDGLAKDLNALKNAKLKAKGKMDQVGNPNSDKTIEKEKEKDKPRIDRKSDKESPDLIQSKPVSKPKPKPEPKSKPNRQFTMRRTDAEDSTDVKRVIEGRPPRKSKSNKNIDMEKDLG